MKYIGDIQFWLITSLNIVAVGLLLSSARLKGKEWLLGFIITLFLSGLGAYAPGLLVRNGMMTMDTYYAFVAPAGVVVAFLRVSAWVCFLMFVVGLTSARFTGSEVGEARSTGVSRTDPAIDLAQGKFVFIEDSLEAIGNRLKGELPNHVEVTIRDKKPPDILVRDGLWRGATLMIDDSDQQMKLAAITYRIPSVMAKAMTAIISVAAFSIIMMFLLAALVGHFVAGVFGIGGVAGFAMYVVVEKLFIANLRRSWAPELHRAIARLRA